MFLLFLNVHQLLLFNKNIVLSIFTGYQYIISKLLLGRLFSYLVILTRKPVRSVSFETNTFGPKVDAATIPNKVAEKKEWLKITKT